MDMIKLYLILVGTWIKVKSLHIMLTKIDQLKKKNHCSLLLSILSIRINIVIKSCILIIYNRLTSTLSSYYMNCKY